jgi:hypothetical protein
MQGSQEVFVFVDGEIQLYKPGSNIYGGESKIPGSHEDPADSVREAAKVQIGNLVGFLALFYQGGQSSDSALLFCNLNLEGLFLPEQFHQSLTRLSDRLVGFRRVLGSHDRVAYNMYKSVSTGRYKAPAQAGKDARGTIGRPFLHQDKRALPLQHAAGGELRGPCLFGVY